MALLRGVRQSPRANSYLAEPRDRAKAAAGAGAGVEVRLGDGLVVREPKARDQNSELIAASKSGNLQDVLKLLDAGVCIDAHGMWGNTPLIVAAQYGHNVLALRLIERGADAHVRNERGATPLLHACVEGLADVVEVLLRAGAVAEPRSPGVVYNSSPEIDAPMRLTPLLAATTNGHLVITHMLLDAGADPGRAIDTTPKSPAAVRAPATVDAAEELKGGRCCLFAS